MLYILMCDILMCDIFKFVIASGSILDCGEAGGESGKKSEHEDLPKYGM